MVIFHSYASLPEGTCVCVCFFMLSKQKHNDNDVHPQMDFSATQPSPSFGNMFVNQVEKPQ